MVLSVLKAARRHIQEIKCDEHIGLRHVLQTAPLHEAHGRVDNRLRGKPMDGTVFQAKDVANQMEGPDLAAAVG
jgi:hypothetical protein